MASLCGSGSVSHEVKVLAWVRQRLGQSWRICSMLADSHSWRLEKGLNFPHVCFDIGLLSVSGMWQLVLTRATDPRRGTRRRTQRLL